MAMRKDQRGYALIWTLTLLILASIILIPMLLLMNTSLLSSQIHENTTMRFYAADAGIEDGILKVLRYVVLPANVGEELSYTLGQQLNNCTVDITIRKVEETTYQIASTSTDVYDGKITSIESYIDVELADFSGLYENVITSPSDVTIQPNSSVVGSVQYNGVLDNKGEIIGELITDPITDWPTDNQLGYYFQAQADTSNPFPYDTIDLNGHSGSLGPLYRQGSLTIKNTNSSPRIVQLCGTVYVTGDLVLLPDCMLALNGETVYVEGNLTLQPGCAVSGTGCLIASGDVDFHPNISSADTDYVFLMSITGNVTLSPADSFYGSVVGNVDVDVQPNCSLEHRSPNYDEFNFPPEFPVELDVLTFTIQ